MHLAKLKQRWLLWLALIVFVVAKLPHLYYGFYWDESWVYAPAISLMHAHGPSLLPNAIPVDYSRGHPLLFHAACAAWMDVFGTSRLAMHSFALFLSLGLAVSVYEIVLKLYGYRTALLSAVLLLLNAYFFAESSFLLTDIALALFGLLSLYCYVREKHALTALCLTLLFFTKESGLVVCAVLGLDVLVGLLQKRITLKSAMAKSLSLAIPLLAMLSFFIMQKHMLGWYLYPGHTSAINLGFYNTMGNMQDAVATVLSKEGIFALYIAAGALATWAIIKQRKWFYLLYVLYALLLYASILLFSSKDFIFYIFLAVSIATLATFFIRPLPFFRGQQARFIKLVAGFCLAYLYFCCVNFYEPRYLIPMLVLVSVVLLAIVTAALSAGISKAMFPYVLAIFAAIGVYNVTSHGTEMSAYDRMDVQQHLVDYFEQHNYYNKQICCKTFFEHIHLTDPKTGFLHSSRSFAYVTDDLQPNTQLVIYDNIDSGTPELGTSERDQIKTNNLTLIYRYQNHKDWVLVYERR